MVNARVAPPTAWRQPDDAYGALAVARVLGPLLGLLAVAPRLAGREGGAWWLVAVAPLIGVFAHKVTMIVHDCSHMALFGSRRLNRLLGRLAGAVIGADYDEFTRVHWLHHRFLAQEVDPQHEDYVDLRGKRRAAVAWHLLNPLFGLSLYKLILFGLGRRMQSTSRQTEQMRQAAASFNPRVQPLSRRLLLIAPAQLAIAFVATRGFRIWWLVFLYPAAAATFGLFFSRLRSYVEHAPPEAVDNPDHVRTHQPNLLDSVMIFELNFNYHLEHHMFPWVASRNLPKLHDMVRRAGYHTEETLSPGVLATLKRRILEPRWDLKTKGGASSAIPDSGAQEFEAVR